MEREHVLESLVSIVQRIGMSQTLSHLATVARRKLDTFVGVTGKNIADKLDDLSEEARVRQTMLRTGLPDQVREFTTLGSLDEGWAKQLDEPVQFEVDFNPREPDPMPSYTVDNSNVVCWQCSEGFDITADKLTTFQGLYGGVVCPYCGARCQIEFKVVTKQVE
jgi:DNA-directed RNA polymerase subunit RPC12/RpoP